MKAIGLIVGVVILFTLEVFGFEKCGASSPVLCSLFVDFIAVNIGMIIRRFIDETF